MKATPQCLLKIRQAYPDLNGKYRDVADYILANPEKIVRCKVKEVAQDCNCDDSQIIRFCQKIGYSGFSDLKMSIAAEFMPVNIEAGPENPFGRVRQDFLANNHKAMHDTVGLLREEEIAGAVELLVKAKKVYLLGSGASGLVAMDLHVKLLRLGFNAVYHQDSGLNRMLFGLIDPDDAVVALSFSGENREVCELAEAAAKKKTPVIALTNFPTSRLARLSTVSLLTASDEKVFRLGAMTSRIAQLLVCDFLIIQLALQNMDRSEENVLRTHEMINNTTN